MKLTAMKTLVLVELAALRLAVEQQAVSAPDDTLARAVGAVSVDRIRGTF